MSIAPLPSRRTVLLAGSVGGLGVLGACSSGGQGTSASSSAVAARPGTTAASAPGTTAASSPARAASGSATTAAAGVVAAPSDGLARLTDIPVGQAVAVTLPGNTSAVVARPTATTAVAFDATCTHQGCTVAPRGAQLHCPCHGSIYNALTGAVILSANGGTNPGQAPLAEVAVHVKNGEVLAGPS